MNTLKPPSFFGDTKPRKILRLLAYHPREFDASVVSIPTKRDPLVTQIRSTDPHSTTCATLGDLDPVPLELLNEILRRSDLRAVSNFRSLNRRARTVVESSFPYKLLLRNAPHVVAALEKTGIASHFSVDDAFHALSTPSCNVCGKFGTYLWIPECIRCCFFCVREAPELMPMSEPDARAAFGLTKSALKGVPIMATLPGLYTDQQRPYRRKRHFLSRERARQAAVDIHGGEEGLVRYVNHGTSKAKVAYDRRVAARDATAAVQGIPNRTKNDPTRFMTVVPFPYFDPSSRITHIGLSCQGCKFVIGRPRLQSDQRAATFHSRGDQPYTMEGIFEHFKSCSDARRLWRAHRNVYFPTKKSSKVRPFLRGYVEMLHQRTKILGT